MSVLTRLFPDSNDDTVIAHSFQDAEPILEQNKVLRTMEQKSDWGRHIACVPNNILNMWLIEEWNRGNKSLRLHSEEYNRLVESKIKDPDWAWLRTDTKGHFTGYNVPVLCR